MAEPVNWRHTAWTVRAAAPELLLVFGCLFHCDGGGQCTSGFKRRDVWTCAVAASTYRWSSTDGLADWGLHVYEQTSPISRLLRAHCTVVAARRTSVHSAGVRREDVRRWRISAPLVVGAGALLPLPSRRLLPAMATTTAAGSIAGTHAWCQRVACTMCAAAGGCERDKHGVQRLHSSVSTNSAMHATAALEQRKEWPSRCLELELTQFGRSK